ncbi:hypothetical protein HYPSUDRAFT_207919 [Hypholoma sublateritium FD-334 SS-4]|uniref:Uncharacterized protein n=1 Tax=Hypholoma sublateritium (strain FD-334 SS-4) TaxID=945553 RepID=A0A0D2N8F0_HYPSF|nr:hypothetical protein HYPSUDRAFT_207919 [Hypholoma sublateritium FD-334 SS-4]
MELGVPGFSLDAQKSGVGSTKRITSSLRQKQPRHDTPRRLLTQKPRRRDNNDALTAVGTSPVSPNARLRSRLVPPRVRCVSRLSITTRVEVDVAHSADARVNSASYAADDGHGLQDAHTTPEGREHACWVPAPRGAHGRGRIDKPWLRALFVRQRALWMSKNLPDAVGVAGCAPEVRTSSYDCYRAPGQQSRQAAFWMSVDMRAAAQRPRSANSAP